MTNAETFARDYANEPHLVPLTNGDYAVVHTMRETLYLRRENDGWKMEPPSSLAISTACDDVRLIVESSLDDMIDAAAEWLLHLNHLRQECAEGLEIRGHTTQCDVFVSFERREADPA